MPSSPVHSPAHSPAHSRLIETLQQLSVLDGRLPHLRFVEVLSKFVDFAGAMDLSDLLRVPLVEPVVGQSEQIGEQENKDADNAANAGLSTSVKALYLKVRGDVMNDITRSFGPDSYLASVRLPQPHDRTFSHENQGLSSYQRFYALQQSEMEMQAIKLSAGIRQHLSTRSAKLAQLVLLDRKLNELLANYSRQALSSLPVLLAKRFQLLCTDTESGQLSLENLETVESPNGLDRFLNEMQQLLLAEWEIRLQPTLGLLEAVMMTEETEIP